MLNHAVLELGVALEITSARGDAVAGWAHLLEGLERARGDAPEGARDGDRRGPRI